VITRRTLIAAGSLLIAYMKIPLVFANAGPPVVPKKVGQVIIWSKKKYIAIKSGKKIVWDKGQPISEEIQKIVPRILKSTIEEFKLCESDYVGVNEVKIFTYLDSLGVKKNYIISRLGSQIMIFDTTCTHEGCAVFVDKTTLTCPCHLSYFDPATGQAISGPAKNPLMLYPSREASGIIYITDKVYRYQ